ncbi:MAG: glycoside hydrolase family 88 protein [Nibricoccus sp.]
MLKRTSLVASSVFLLSSSYAQPAAPGAQSVTPPATDAQNRTPAERRVQPNYPVPYAPAKAEEIKAVMDRVLGYLEQASPVKMIDRDTRKPVTDLAHLPPNAALDRTDFLLTSYEWGVTYSGMLLAADVTGDKRYRDYVAERLNAIATLATHLKNQPPPPQDEQRGPQRMLALRSVLKPETLDDSGAMCAAMIKANRARISPEALRLWIDNYMNWVFAGQFRLPDRTLARNRPMANTLWLDDLYMSVPALSQMGVLTGDQKYFDDAVRQILQFSSRMFIPEKGLYRHGWVQDMDPHPAFHWGRANGWAFLAMTELLEVLPKEHPGRAAVLEQYRALAKGLAPLQDSTGLWHQLLDRPDSYLETSASAMFVYSIARGINRGWLDGKAYGPMVSLGWNAVAQKVNATGQVEGTCVGTGMGFDPAFYYYRPASVYAAHGYGPVLLAGAEMIALRRSEGAKQQTISDGGLHFAPSGSRN